MPPNKPLKSTGMRVLDIFLFSLVSIWGVSEGALFVGGIILCIMIFEPWPMKFIYMAIWIVVVYFVSKLIAKISNSRKKRF